MYIHISYSFIILLNLSLVSVQQQFHVNEISINYPNSEYNTYITKDSRGNLWISTTEGPLLYNRSRNKKFGTSDGLLDANVQSNFYEDSKGDIWFSTYTGVVSLDKSYQSIKTYQISSEISENVDYHCFWFNSSTNELWFVANNAFYTINTLSSKIQKKSNIHTDSKYFIISEYQNKIILIGIPRIIRKGYEVFDIVDNQINFLHSNTLIGNFRTAILFQEKIFLATKDYLYQLQDDFSVKQYMQMPQNSYALANYKNQLFISTKTTGLYRIEDNASFELVYKNYNAREIYTDKDEIMWIDDISKGIIGLRSTCPFNVKTLKPSIELYKGNKKILFPKGNNRKNENQQISINHSGIFSRSANALHIDTVYSSPITDFYPIDSITFLVIDNASIPIVVNRSTSGKINFDTIQSYDSEERTFFFNERYFLLDQTNDMKVREMYLSRDSILFYGTSSFGLYCKNLETGETRAFTIRDGLPSNNFNLEAGKYDDGRLWFGTDKGLVVFHPDSISFDFCTPRMNIEEILVNNQYIQSNTYVGDMTKASLAYDENNLAIRGVAIDCMFSPDVKSYYRFTGVDTTWKEVKNGDYLRYERLDPGDYKLEMYALSPNLVKSEIKAIDFTVNLPYWQTWWFRLLGLAAIGGLAYGGIQLYVWNRLREERQKCLQLETQQAERNRIADELHDDLGGGLSVIRFLSEELQDTAADKRTKTLVEKISSSSQQLLTSMREVIWAMDTRNDTVGRLTEQIHDYASAYLHQHNIPLDWKTNISDPEIVLTGEKRRNIYLISKEALHNIVKHAQASGADIQIAFVNNELSIDIRDNGLGYDPNTISEGRGRGSMNRRAQAIEAKLEINSTPEEGTHIQLKYQFK